MSRRISKAELTALNVVGAYVEAQRAYYMVSACVPFIGAARDFLQHVGRDCRTKDSATHASPSYPDERAPYLFL